MARFRTPYNFQENQPRGEVNLLPSETIPDQSLSVKEILDRYARGLPMNGERPVYYTGEDEDFADLEHLDLAERQDVIEGYRAELAQLKRQFIADNEKKLADDAAALNQLKNEVAELKLKANGPQPQ